MVREFVGTLQWGFSMSLCLTYRPIVFAICIVVGLYVLLILFFFIFIYIKLEYIQYKHKYRYDQSTFDSKLNYSISF